MSVRCRYPSRSRGPPVAAAPLLLLSDAGRASRSRLTPLVAGIARAAVLGDQPVRVCSPTASSSIRPCLLSHSSRTTRGILDGAAFRRQRPFGVRLPIRLALCARSRGATREGGDRGCIPNVSASRRASARYSPASCPGAVDTRSTVRSRAAGLEGHFVTTGAVPDQSSPPHPTLPPSA